MSEVLSNNYETTLASSMDNSQLTLSVTTATGAPTTGEFRLFIRHEGSNTDEIVTVTAVSGTTFTIVRASEAVAGVQAASAHASGATVALVVTAGSLRNLGLVSGFIGARVYHNTTQALSSSGTLTAVAFNSERYDTDSFHDNSTNNSRFTIPAGLGDKYIIGATLEFAANATGNRALGIKLNGATYLAFQTVPAASGGSQETRLEINTEYDLIAGDYIEIFAMQSSGGSLNITNAGNYTPEAWIRKSSGGRVGSAVGVHVYNSADQTATNATEYIVLFNSERKDSDGFHSTSSNTGRLTVPAGMGGRYAFGWSLRFSGNVTAGDYVAVFKGATTYVAVNQLYGGVLTAGAGEVDLAAGEYITLVVNQSANRDLKASDTGDNQNRTEFWMYRQDAVPAVGPVLLLDHAYGSDDSGISIAGSGSFTDLSANETFTKVRSNSVIRINAKIGAQINDSSTGDDSYLIRLLIDSAGTSVPIAVSFHIANATMNGDFFSCGGAISEIVSGLAAGSHTIKWQMGAAGAVTNSFYCRPSAAGPYEYAKCQVIEEG